MFVSKPFLQKRRCYVYIINMRNYFVHYNIFVVDKITSSVQIGYQNEVKVFADFNVDLEF
jgi:hypothetical protein